MRAIGRRPLRIKTDQVTPLNRRTNLLIRLINPTAITALHIQSSRQRHQRTQNRPIAHLRFRNKAHRLHRIRRENIHPRRMIRHHHTAQIRLRRLCCHYQTHAQCTQQKARPQTNDAPLSRPANQRKHQSRQKQTARQPQSKTQQTHKCD